MRFDPCIVSVISVVVLLVKFVGGYSLMFVCSVNKSFVGRYYYYNYNSTTKNASIFAMDSQNDQVQAQALG